MITEERNKDNSKIVKEVWDVKTPGELFLPINALSDFIVNKDPCFERSMKVVQSINQALTTYKVLLDMLQSMKLQDQILANTQIRIKTVLSDYQEQNSSSIAEDQNDSSYILP